MLEGGEEGSLTEMGCAGVKRGVSIGVRGNPAWGVRCFQHVLQSAGVTANTECSFAFMLRCRTFPSNLLHSKLACWYRVSLFTLSRALFLVISGAAMQPGLKEDRWLLRPRGQDALAPSSLWL